MDFDKERNALIQQIEISFSERRSDEELIEFLQRMELADSQNNPYETRHWESMLRGHSWQEMLGDWRLVDMLKDPDYVRAISNEALVYYLPAYMIQTATELDWNIYLTILTPRIVDILGRLSLAQINALIALAEFKVLHRQLIDEGNLIYFSRSMIDSFEDLGLRILGYLDEMGSILKRHENDNQSPV